MNNTQLKEAACDDLTYAKSTLSLIINNDVPFDTHAFNTVEGVVEQIDRALKMLPVSAQNKLTPAMKIARYFPVWI